jgi:hypothetical protein
LAWVHCSSNVIPGARDQAFKVVRNAVGAIIVAAYTDD